MPVVGTTVMDPISCNLMIFNGTQWVTIADFETDEQSQEELHEQHPQLKEMWEEYCVMKKLLTGE